MEASRGSIRSGALSSPSGHRSPSSDSLMTEQDSMSNRTKRSSSSALCSRASNVVRQKYVRHGLGKLQGEWAYHTGWGGHVL